jgi:predicted SAM-dependent methyltransferase
MTPLVNPNRHRQTGAPLKLNVGCGAYPLRGYANLDSVPYQGVEVVADVPPLPYDDASLDEVWSCHFLEHLSQEDGAAFLAECYRVLVPGGALGVVVPDTREIMRRWLNGESGRVEFPAGRFWDISNLDDICSMFIYSTIQPSHHLWSYDLMTLSRAVERAGFRVTGEIDREYDPRLGTGQWYQCGISAIKDDRERG